jgi:hypothetical protein
MMPGRRLLDPLLAVRLCLKTTDDHPKHRKSNARMNVQGSLRYRRVGIGNVEFTRIVPWRTPNAPLESPT